jgi:putative efflux protein, MATE family
MLAIYNSGAAIYRSIGDSKTSMKVSILMNIINVVGNSVGIFVLHMGVAGVAIPSVISRGVAAIAITILASRNKNAIVYLKIEEVFRLRMDYMRRILYIGIPSGIENSLFQVGRVAVVSIISNFGRAEIAANAIANNLDGLGVNMGNAISIAMITVIGRCVGAGNYKEAKYYVKKLMFIGYSVIIIPTIFILGFQSFFISIYKVSDATRELTAVLVWIHMGMAVFLWPLSFILPNALRAGNDVKFTMTVSLFSMAVFRFATSLFIANVFHIGAIGVWCAMIIDWVFRSSNFAYRFISGKWWHKDLKKGET